MHVVTVRQEDTTTEGSVEALAVGGECLLGTAFSYVSTDSWSRSICFYRQLKLIDMFLPTAGVNRYVSTDRWSKSICFYRHKKPLM